MVVVSIVDILFISGNISVISALITAFELVFAIKSCAVIFAFLFLIVIVHFPIIKMFVLLLALNLICVFVIFAAGFMFLYTFMGITFNSVPVSILKFVFVSFMYNSVDHLFCCTVFTLFFNMASMWWCSYTHGGFCQVCVHVTRIFVFASAHFCKITTLAAFSAVFVICWTVTFVM